MDKKTQLSQLFEEYSRAFAEKPAFVCGDGNADATVLLIGEAPGKDEIKQGRPFVGKAGQNLSEFLQYIHLERSDIYITNVIKYRLSKVHPVRGTESNRPATREEIESSIPFLQWEIQIVQPKVIVTLGNVPLRAVKNDLSAKTTIGDFHGEMHQMPIGDGVYSVYPLYHPASIIYNRTLKDVYLGDLENLEKHL